MVTELSERQREITRLLNRDGFLSVVDLAASFGVSDMTIRRDAKRLAEDGLARVVHGGLSTVNASGHSAYFAARTQENSEGKRRIAAAARTLFGKQDVVILDAGTSTYEIANQMSAEFTGTIITNSVPIIQRSVQMPEARTICLGGELLHDSQAFVGPIPIAALSGLRASIAFIGVSGLHHGGFYVERELERETKRAAMGVADRVAVVATHDKINRSALSVLARYSEVDFVITDEVPSRAVAEEISHAGVELLVASGRD